MKYPIILTSCIAPPSINDANFRADPKLRLNDYLLSLHSWLHYEDERVDAIIFIDNSNADLTRLKELAAKENVYNRKIEFISFTATNRPVTVHYGYSEMEILDYCIDNSLILSDYDFFIKVTGRLFFPNLKRLLSFCDLNHFLFISDSRDYNLWIKKAHYVLTTLFISSIDFYKKNIYQKKYLLLEHKFTYMEEVYYNLLFNMSNVVHLRFPFNVNPVGIGAHSNVNYSSFKKRLFANLRGVMRSLFPNFKI